MRSKLTMSHSTRIDAVEKLYRAIQHLPEIKKVGLGVIKPAGGGGQTRVKMLDESGCLLLRVRGGTAVQEFRVYSTNSTKTKADIRAVVNILNWQLTEG